jgi:hypothetical protein
MSTARVVQRLRAENKMLVQRDVHLRETITDLQARLDNAYHATLPVTTSACSEHLAELEDELQIALKSADESRERCQALDLELASQRQLVADIMRKHKRERQSAEADQQANQKQLQLVISSCQVKEAEHMSSMSSLRTKYEDAMVENARLSAQCDELTAENKNIETSRATTAERLAKALSSLQEKSNDNNHDDDDDDNNSSMRIHVAAAVQAAREQWQQRASTMAKEERLRAEERLKRVVRRGRIEAEVAMSKVTTEAEAALENQRLKNRAVLAETKASAAASAVELVASVRAACEKNMAAERQRSAMSVPLALQGVQKRFQQELEKKKVMYDKELGTIDVNHRMERFRQSQMSAVRVCSMYFRQQRAKKVALAMWQWKSAVAEARLGEVICMTLEHTRRAGAVYCVWGIMQRVAFRKVVVAFRHWETLSFEGSEDEEDKEEEVVSSDNEETLYSSSSIRTSGLRPWMFESTLHTRGVWKGEIGQIKNKMYRTRYHTVLLYMYYCTATVLLCLLFVHIHHLQQYQLSHGPHQRSSVPQILDLGSLCFQQLCKYADLL